MTIGTGPFGLFGAGLPSGATVSPLDRGTLVSSRKIDDAGRYVQTADEAGSFDGMTDVAQQVLILCTLVRDPPKITRDYAATVRARLRKALEPLTKKPPRIEILGIDVDTTTSAKGARKVVRYRDLSNGQADSVEL